MLDAPLDCTCAPPAQSLRNCEIRNARSFLVPAASNTTGSSDTVGDMHMLARQVAAVRQLAIMLLSGIVHQHGRGAHTGPESLAAAGVVHMQCMLLSDIYKSSVL